MAPVEARATFLSIRGDARKTAKSLKLVIDGVRDGKSLMVFPEGTRTPDGHLQEFKHGAFKIAVRAKVPVVPVAIRGTFELLPKTTLAPHPGRVDVFICRLLTPRTAAREIYRDLWRRRGARSRRNWSASSPW